MTDGHPQNSICSAGGESTLSTVVCDHAICGQLSSPSARSSTMTVCRYMPRSAHWVGPCSGRCSRTVRPGRRSNLLADRMTRLKAVVAARESAQKSAITTRGAPTNELWPDQFGKPLDTQTQSMR